METTAQIISQSSNSTIYLLKESEWGVPVIKKILNKSFPGTVSLAQFYNEYETTHELEIEGIRPPLKSGRDGNRHALWLEYVEGDTIKEAFKEKGRSLREFLQTGISIARILGEIHKANIIHKDISGGNIIVNVEKDFEVKIIDFGIATRIDLKKPYLGNPERLEGNLGYISPEQTGRMNRVVDYRTDFYSLGIVLYEMLTGVRPFISDDPVELVHAHMAQAPISPTDLNSEVPVVISDIVLKLLEKNAEDRYQSAFGLQKDLEKCLHYIQATGEIRPFTLATEDFSGKFSIPEKLYGREEEVKVLVEAFGRVSQGAHELMLVGGYSGTGKTALVNESHKPITEARGYFIDGKFDQFQRNVPYFAMIQAFQEFTKLLLSENEESLASWKSKISSALGTEGKIMTDVIPGLELIIGPQPEVPDLGGKEAQNRFNYVFRNFLNAICRPEHPLVMFIDDLQWADSGSLDLLKVLATDKHNQYLLLIGAYRDNEVSPSHPFIQAVTEMEEEQAIVNRIHVKNLTQSNVNSLIAESLLTTKDKTSSLTSLVYEKTQGNAFFLRQFLKSLFEEGLLEFDFNTQKWNWDIVNVEKLNMTDNVIELMSGKIKKLTQDLQEALKMASCIGNRFDLKTISLAIGVGEEKARKTLEYAMIEGLVAPLGSEYSFVHDRIQQAAYSLIPNEEKSALHLQIGRLLLDNIPEGERDERLFDIVNQLNWGVGIIEDENEKETLAYLNLAAGQRAKSSAAYIPAFEYLKTGLRLLKRNPWSSQYQLALSLYTEVAESAYLSANFEDMDTAIEAIFACASNLLDKVQAYRIRILSFKARNQLLEAIDTGLEILKELGVSFPENPTEEDTGKELMATMALLEGKSSDDLLNLPEMSDLSMKAALLIITDINSSVYWARAELFAFIVFKSVEISVKHGNTEVSAFAFSTYGVILSGVVGDMPRAYEFGDLGIKLLEKFNAKEWLTQVYTPHYALIVHWNEHIQETMKPLVESIHIGLETGGIEYAMINANIYCIHGYLMGRPLKALEREIEDYSSMMYTYKQETNYNFNQIYHQAVLNLLGRSEDPQKLIGTSYNEEEMLPKHLEANDMTASFFLFFNKLILNYLFENYEEAERNRNETASRLTAILAKLENTAYRLYDSLLALALYPKANAEKQEILLKRVEENQEMMQKWANHAPMNFLHKYYLVEAEKLSLFGTSDAAVAMYDKAISLSEKSLFLNEEALAYELAGKHFLRQNLNDLAEEYLNNAYNVYHQWEARAKMDHLAATYPMISPISSRSTTPSPGDISRTQHSLTTASDNALLDLSSVMKASTVISGEIVLSRLLDKLMRIVIENAGADKGYLLIKSNDKLLIQAEQKLGSNEVTIMQNIPAFGSNLLPEQIITYVSRTSENIVIDEAIKDEQFNKDPYIVHRQPKSVLCAPIAHQGALTGMIYLENNLATHAFTEDRTQLLNLLSGQIAVSINNALLYENLEHNVRERTAEVVKQKEELESAYEKLKALDEFKEGMTGMIVHDLKNPLNAILNPGTGSRDEQLKMVQQSGKQMLNMVQNILDVYKYEDSKMRIFTKEVYLYDIAREAGRQVRFLVDRKSITFKNLIHTNLGVIGDEEILERVFVNLLTNAIKYTPSMGKITISSKVENGMVWCGVADTGVGIPLDKQDTVFLRFGQVSAKRSGSIRSTGLGLTFCKMAVEAHDGLMGVESEVGKGTSFWFTLPEARISGDEDRDSLLLEDEEETTLNFSAEDCAYLKPFAEQLKAVPIYKITSLRKILQDVEDGRNSQIDQWKSDLLFAVSGGNIETYDNLLNKVME